MNITLHTRSRWSNQGKLQSSRNLNKLEFEWYDKAAIHSHKEYNKTILKPVVDILTIQMLYCSALSVSTTSRTCTKKQNQYLTINDKAEAFHHHSKLVFFIGKPHHANKV